MQKIHTYKDILIGTSDQEYIDRISESLGIDYWNCEINLDYWLVCNQIIDYIIREEISNLDVSLKSKDRLYDSIYCNSIDSWIDENADTFPKSEREKIRDLIESL